MDPLSFANRVFALCFKHQGSLSSWGRTLKHNKDVGGVEDSYHMLWLGADVVLNVMEKNGKFESDAGELGLKAILEGDHYHLQPAKIGGL
jgi:hypothetical protein